ncbi:M20 family metallo-hydrolase [Candidatus Avelusimicrobium faecicola]|uniref:M20 family metallo-hydrolase n=1 Tax=Candidatus Avelusimicrobium faecicola TaxID=3416205 RepID=UPI002A630764|nr:M20 family metallo-hydrolase [Spirochaetota bacterium]MDY6129544.1 M20 family metallo-hydrolase [Elusimicrobiaceae bacterium]
MEDTKKIFAKIDSYKDFVVDVQTKMIACPAVSPHAGGDGETAKAEYLLALLKTMKFDEVFVINAKDPKSKTGVRPNIVAKYYGQNKQKTLWVMAHMDIVPPGDLKLWKTDPFKAVVKGDKIYGRGSEDNQQGLVSGLLTVKAFMDLGIRPPVNYALLLNADEEIGSTYGIVDILKHHGKTFSKEDSFLVPDGGNPQGTMVEIAEKNMLWVKFTVQGKQTHASMPKAGINANRVASHLIVRLEELTKIFNKKNTLFAPESASTFEPTKREANVPNVNTIPGTDVFYLDCRVLPCYNNEDVLKEITRIVKGVEKQFKVKVKIELEQCESSKPTDKKAPLVGAVIKAAKAVYKNQPKAMGVGGGTVAAYLRNKGYSAVVFSKLDDMAHQPNEYSSIKNTLGDAKVFALVALELK